MPSRIAADGPRALSRRALPATLLLLAALALPGAPARASFTHFDAFSNAEYTQTANDTPPSGTPSYFFASRLFFDTPGDITAANGFNGASGQTFTYAPQAGNYVLAQTGFLTAAQLSNYNLGSTEYNVTAGNLPHVGGGAGLPAPLFTSELPYLTGNSYNLLQGLNASQDATVSYNGFTPVVGANESDIFITITNATTNAVAFSESLFNDSSAGSFVLPSGTLAAGTSYNLEVDFSSRLNTTGVFDGNSVPFTAGYDNRTEIGFTTAAAVSVPEPSSVALTALGAASVAVVARRRRRPSGRGLRTED